MKKKRGFTLLEIMVAVSIMTVLLVIVTASVSAVRARTRNAQVKTDKQNLILALVRAREASPTYTYPGIQGWQCLKASGSCWKGTYSGNSTISNALTPYLPGGTFPIPPGNNANQFRTGGYAYNPVPTTQGGVTASFIVWAQEKQILPEECNGSVQQLETGIYYCYEALPR